MSDIKFSRSAKVIGGFIIGVVVVLVYLLITGE
jgi:hypothetical protein